MQTFRKRHAVIEAIQYSGTPQSNREIIDFARGTLTPAYMDTEIGKGTRQDPNGLEEYPVLLINTLEGTKKVDPGDWVIKGAKGEFYPCKPDVFEQTYEKAY